MSLGARDREAFELVRSRAFGGAFVAAFHLELQTRRLTLRLYGTLRRGDAGTYLGTLTSFGAAALACENAAGAFPESVRVERFALDYDESADLGSAVLHGAQAWTLSWSFDGLAYDECPYVLASLTDDLT